MSQSIQRPRRVPRGGLRARLLLTHLLVVAVGVGTLFGATLAITPTLFERTMGGMMGPAMSQAMMPGQAETVTQAFQAAMVEALLVSAGVGVLAAVIVSLVVSARIVLPLQRLVGASQGIAAGHYAERVPGPAGAQAPDELGALADQFNTMAAAVEAAERRRVVLIGDLAHELRTPLATIEGYTEGLLDGVVPPDAETWALLHDEAGRMRQLVQDLQDLSRAEARQLALQPQPTAPALLAAQAVDRLAAQFAEKPLTLVTAVPETLAATPAPPPGSPAG